MSARNTRTLRLRFCSALIAGLSACAVTAAAHHSSSLYYDVEDRITVTGEVTEFLFANPHAILKFEVTAEDGSVQQWVAETTSPSLLRRRGWSRQSFEPGQTVTLEGMPSLDGSWLMRITRAWHEDGSEIGIPSGVDD
jgi:hypothetical protein